MTGGFLAQPLTRWKKLGSPSREVDLSSEMSKKDRRLFLAKLGINRGLQESIGKRHFLRPWNWAVNQD